MANWRKVLTTQDEINRHRELVTCAAQSKSGYRTGSVNGSRRHYWSVPSSYYGINRNVRHNHQSSPTATEPDAPDNGSIPAMTGYGQFDYRFEQRCKFQSGDKIRVQWKSTTGHTFPDDEIVYIAPVIVKPSDNVRESHNNFISYNKANDYTYMVTPNGYDGSSSTEGIFKCDMSEISGYTSNDTTFWYGFTYTHSGSEVVIPAGSMLVFFITNTMSTSSSTSEYMRDLLITVECEVY